MKQIAIALAQSLVFGFGFLKLKESNKYIKDILDIQRELNEEFQRPYEEQDDLVIITLQQRLLDYQKILSQYGTPHS